MTVTREQLDAMRQGRLGWESRPGFTLRNSFREDGEGAFPMYLLRRSKRLRLLKEAGRDASKYLDADFLARRETLNPEPRESERSHATRY